MKVIHLLFTFVHVRYVLDEVIGLFKKCIFSYLFVEMSVLRIPKQNKIGYWNDI